MKETINGKRYNTETAEELCSNKSDCGRSDFRWFEEALYITKKGAFFLAGEGHAMSKYSESYGNMTGPGSGIIPLAKREALSYLENLGENDLIDEYFSDIIEEA